MKTLRKQGMTLIEVLIALAVLAIALTALVKATSQDIRDTDYLRDKTIALWVAMDGMSLVQLDLVNTPVEQTKTMLGQNWYWTAKRSKSPDPHVDKIEITVRKDRKNPVIITLPGFKQVVPS